MELTVSCLGSVYFATVASELRSSLDSLLAGTHLPDEIVVVVDGPVGSDLDLLLRSYCALGVVKIVRLSSNQGLAAALNAGLAVCVGEIVCRFDTDDINLPSRILETKQAFASDPLLDIVGSSVYEFVEDAKYSVTLSLKSVALRHSSIVKNMDYANPLNHPSVAFKRSSIADIGGYIHMKFFEDYYLWLRARKARLRFGNISIPLVFMRRSGSLSRRSGLGYARCELKFLFSCTSKRLLNPLLIPLFLLRCLSRLLPSSFQRFQSLLPWRCPVSIDDAPQLLQWLAYEKPECIRQAVGHAYWTDWS